MVVWLWWRGFGGESGEGVLIFIPDFSMGTNKLIN